MSALWKEKPARLIDELAKATQGLTQELERIGIAPQSKSANDPRSGSEETRTVANSGLSGKAERRTEKPEKNLPRIPLNKEVLQLAKRINRELGRTAKTKKEIALGITDYDEKRALNLLRQLRAHKHLLE